MVSLGDIMGIVAFLVGLGGTGWAMTVTMGLLFPLQTERASGATKGAFVRGLLPLGLLLMSVVAFNLPLPGSKLLGLALFLAILAVAALGLAGLARIAGGRIASLSPEMGPYPAFLRGAAFLVAACLFPLLGWFLFAPVAFVVALGAGWAACARRPAALEA